MNIEIECYFDVKTTNMATSVNLKLEWVKKKNEYQNW